MDMFLVGTVGLSVLSLLFSPLVEGSVVMGALMSRAERMEDMFVICRGWVQMWFVVREETDAFVEDCVMDCLYLNG